MAFVATKIGRRQDSGTGVSPVYSVSRATGETPLCLFSLQPFGPRPRLGGFSALLTPHVSISAMLVVYAGPARTALKNSQLIRPWPGESRAISRTRH
jgi:hypothetical protein